MSKPSPLGGIFELPFAEQVAAFRLRLGDLRPTSAWTDLAGQDHDRAFMVAGAVKADLLADLAAAVDKAITKGTTLEEFRRDFREIVTRNGWHGWTGEGTKGGEAWRTRVIYRTNLATSYAAGRHAQLVKTGYKFWIYRHGGSLEPRLDHLSWDGLVLPADHPFWSTHYPPNGWGCRCEVRGADNLAGIRRAGGDPGKTLPPGWDKASPKTGAPQGIDKGWNHAPGRTVAETVSLGARKIASLPPEIGSDFGAGMQGIIERHWPLWLADVQTKARHEPGLVGVLSRETIGALTSRGVAPASAEIMVNPGLLVGPKATRHDYAGDALLPEDWLALPQLLRRPTAVLIDSRTGRLIFVLRPTNGQAPQLALALDYRTRIRRETVLTNSVVSAYRPLTMTLLQRIASGGLLLLLGGVA